MAERDIMCAELTWILTGDTRKIFVSNIKTVDESNSAHVLVGLTTKVQTDEKHINEPVYVADLPRGFRLTLVKVVKRQRAWSW